MYIITTRRITSGELLKQRKGLRIAGGYGTPAYTSSQIGLTPPLRLPVTYMGFQLSDMCYDAIHVRSLGAG